MTEFELKFQVPEAVLQSLAATLEQRGARRQRLQAHYHDTADDLLARNGFSLRLRKEGAHWVQTLKAVGDSAVRRLEHNVPLPDAGPAGPTLDLTRHDGSEAGTALSALLGEQPQPVRLVERHVTDIERLRCELDVQGAVVEAALDVGQLRAGDARADVRELELEHVAGPAAGLFVLARGWAEHGGLSLCTLSKAERGMRLANGLPHGQAVKAGTPRLDEAMDGAALLRAVLRSALDQVLANASELAAGSREAEHVHQARVGLRRLRTALRELGALAPGGVDEAWQTPLAETFNRLGQVRDDEVVAEAVRPLLEAANAPKLRWAASLPPDPGETVRDAGFQRVLIEMLAFALDDADAAPPALPHDEARKHVAERLQRLHKRVLRDGRRFDRLDVETQHRVRKRLKRLRYLAEFVQPLWREKAVERFLKRMRPAQDALGAHNDVVVAASRFGAEARGDAGSAFAAGYLQAHLQVTARGARRALRRAAEAPRFWD